MLRTKVHEASRWPVQYRVTRAPTDVWLAQQLRDATLIDEHQLSEGAVSGEPPTDRLLGPHGFVSQLSKGCLREKSRPDTVSNHHREDQKHLIGDLSS